MHPVKKNWILMNVCLFITFVIYIIYCKHEEKKEAHEKALIAMPSEQEVAFREDKEVEQTIFDDEAAAEKEVRDALAAVKQAEIEVIQTEIAAKAAQKELEKLTAEGVTLKKKEREEIKFAAKKEDSTAKKAKYQVFKAKKAVKVAIEKEKKATLRAMELRSVIAKRKE